MAAGQQDFAAPSPVMEPAPAFPLWPNNSAALQSQMATHVRPTIPQGHLPLIFLAFRLLSSTNVRVRFTFIVDETLMESLMFALGSSAAVVGRKRSGRCP